ncbi:hypothetical protein HNP67_001076 [Borreliella californiensis]|uniref:Uncharacterized protein n=1 Tax=Borreliella californiensis TaxID=373543 RepID=A0A7X0DQK0_9SPIR|nr:hypothetical protein [Borreliella californiensis]MBB6213581.1 hypothetical protein [Borreliella californiensis]
MKVKYKLDLKNYLYLNIGSQIRDIYSRIISNNYSDMGISFEYQDFFAPVNEVKEIKFMEIKVCVKDVDTESISKISDSDFQTNKKILPLMMTQCYFSILQIDCLLILIVNKHENT